MHLHWWQKSLSCSEVIFPTDIGAAHVLFILHYRWRLCIGRVLLYLSYTANHIHTLIRDLLFILWLVSQFFPLVPSTCVLDDRVLMHCTSIERFLTSSTELTMKTIRQSADDLHFSEVEQILGKIRRHLCCRNHVESITSRAHRSFTPNHISKVIVVTPPARRALKFSPI